VREGKFRDDLYFRLNVVRIVMPPLRDEKKTSRFWSADFCAIFAGKTRNRFSTSCRMPWTRSLRTIGPATSASCAPQSSTASSWRQGKQITLRDLPSALRQVATAKLPGGSFTN
jgi:Transcriptional regulator containing PAS, AAA-type ATPase, and DNA-binding domains